MDLDRLIGIDRWKKQLAAAIVDIVTLWVAAWIAFVIRLGEGAVLTDVQWLFIGAAPILAMPGFVWLGLYRSVIRFVGEQALLSIAQAVIAAAAFWLLLAAMMGQMGLIAGMPRTVPVIYMVIAFALVSGTRFTARWFLWKSQRTRFNSRQALIYGAGANGQQVALVLRQGVEFFPAGFIDDTNELHGKDVAGLRVYAPADLGMLIRRFEISDLILSEDAFTHRSRRQIMRELESHSVRIRVVPGLMNAISHYTQSLATTDLDPLDLLDREPEQEIPGEITDLYQAAVVLVTGAAGSIGSEICRRVLHGQPKKVVLLDHNEAGLYQIHMELNELIKRMHVDIALEPVLADVRDANSLKNLFQSCGPKFVFHAAAYKHVPLIEQNVIEGARVNIFGTLHCMAAAAQAQTEHFVLISTDKAVNPTSVMGMTKRVAELLILDEKLARLPGSTKTVFSLVRFGNVLDSSGSVIPLFRRQISLGGPVTVTHPDVTRYFMTIPQAASLVLRAPRVSYRRDVLLLEMGSPVKILDIAKRMIRFSGLRIRDVQHPNGDIEIVFTGLRPGEKLHEELSYQESIEQTSEPGILRFSNEHQHPPQAIDLYLRDIERCCNTSDANLLIEILKFISSEVDPNHVRARLA